MDSRTIKTTWTCRKCEEEKPIGDFCTVHGKPIRLCRECEGEYQKERYRRGRPPRPTLEQRFWSYVDKRLPDECWEWNGGRAPTGYGTFGVASGKARRAHRVAWELIHGAAPGELCVLHRCDNPPCVNPAHLFLGTQLDNARDKMRKKRYRNGGRVDFAVARQIRTMVRYAPPRVVAHHFGIRLESLLNIVHHETWREE